MKWLLLIAASAAVSLLVNRGGALVNSVARLLCGDAREMLRTLPKDSVQCCVTSPPYFGLRDYGVPAGIWGGESGCAHRAPLFTRAGGAV